MDSDFIWIISLVFFGFLALFAGVIIWTKYFDNIGMQLNDPDHVANYVNRRVNNPIGGLGATILGVTLLVFFIVGGLVFMYFLRQILSG